MYNIQFLVTGSYICITDYLSAIENDSELILKIEDFSMTTYSEGDLQAEFVCNDITIEGISSTLGTSSETTDSEYSMEETETIDSEMESSVE